MSGARSPISEESPEGVEYFLCRSLIVDEKLQQLYSQKEILEREVDSSVNYLRQMNEIEKRSKEVNEYSSSQDLQKQLEQTTQSIERIEQETKQLRAKMEDNRTKIMNIYTAFTKLKNEIFEVKMEEESIVCSTNHYVEQIMLKKKLWQEGAGQYFPNVSW